MFSSLGFGSTPAAATEEDRDAAYARSLQEQEDAELAHRMAAASLAGSRAGGAGGSAQQVHMICSTCNHRATVEVPPGTQPGSLVRVACPRCTVMNEFPAPRQAGFAGMPGPGMGGAFPPSMLGGGSGFPPSMLGGGAAGPGGTASLRPGDLVPPPLDQAESPHVACEIADRAVEMLVDTGAQSSVISMPLVRQFNLESRLDSRQQGIASGVGQARILGRLRGIPVKMGHVEFSLDFSVLGIDQPLLILGVDQMRRFKCVVDLDKQMLLFGGRDGVEVPFLPEPQQAMTYRSAGGCPQM